MSTNSSPKIVIVDSNEKWRDRIIGYLQENGFECISASNLKFADQLLSGTVEFTLAFVDQVVVENEKEQIRSFVAKTVYPDLYVVILISGHLTFPKMARYFAMGSYDCVEKPYAPRSFLRMVEYFRRELNEEDLQSKLITPSFLDLNFGFII